MNRYIVVVFEIGEKYTREHGITDGESAEAVVAEWNEEYGYKCIQTELIIVPVSSDQRAHDHASAEQAEREKIKGPGRIQSAQKRLR